MGDFWQMFSYGFMIKALIAGILIAISAALVGVPLVLRKNSMLSDGLSHVAFGAFAVASVLGLAPLPVALLIVILASFFILRASENSKIYGDAGIALLSVSALAIGTFVVSVSGSNVDINNYLFGSILAINDLEIWLSVILCVMVISVYIVFHNKIFAVTFDEKFARAIGVNTRFYNWIFAILSSVVVVLGMRLMGALLISSLIIFPTLTARVIFKKFKSVAVASAVIAGLTFLVGLLISYFASAPTGATVVICSLLVYVLTRIFDKIFS